MRLIDADALHKSIVDRYWTLHRMYEAAQDEQTLKNAVAKLVCLVEHAMLVKEAPTIDAAPVVHARWEDECSGYRNCSACGCEHPIRDARGYLVDDEYCPVCGAKMDAKEEV